MLSLLVALPLTSAAGPAFAQLSKVVQADDNAPGSTVYRSFRRPEVGGGTAAFTATIRSSTSQSGILKASASPGSVVALRNTTFGDIMWKRLSRRPAINSAGQAAWLARVTGPPTLTFHSGVFSEIATDEVVAVRGQQVPGQPAGYLIDQPERPDISDNGDVVFFSTINGITLTASIFRCSGGDGNCYTGSGTLEEMVTDGDTYFDSISAETREICELTEHVDASTWGIAFFALTAPTFGGCAAGMDETILRLEYGTSTIRPVAKAGDPAEPGAGPRRQYRFDGPPAINNSGDVAFLGETVSGAQQQEVIYFCNELTCPADPSDLPQDIVRQHDNDFAGRDLTRLKSVGLSDLDDVSFQAVANSTVAGSGFGIYLAQPPYTPPALRIIGKNDPTPITDSFGFFGIFGEADRPSMSSDGHVAFKARVRWSDRGRDGIWMYDAHP